MQSDAGAIVAAGGTIQQTRTQYSGAISVQRKRNRKDVLQACIEEARLCGPDFYYNWSVKDKNSPTGKSIIEGTSIDGAMILARNYGNCAVPVQLLADTPRHWIIEATFLDLETGFNVTRLFRQRKSQKTMGDEERMQDIAFQIGQSKAQRNVIVKAMPVWLLEKCFSEAKAMEAEKYKDVAKHAARFVDSYAKGGVTKDMLEKKVGRNVASWTPQDIAILAAIARGIKEGSTTIQNEFLDEPASEEQKPPAAPVEVNDDGEVLDESIIDRQPGDDDR